MKSEAPKIKLGVSSCLMGEPVRFDSGHKRNQYINQVLTDYFDFSTFCPEMSIGLGTPREAIRLVQIDDQVHCVGSKTPSLDVTQKLYEVADQQKNWHHDLCGYILKKSSPSCGMERVNLYKGKQPDKTGVGLYAKRLMENFPHLPVEEEARLGDAKLRENFIQRVYIYSRWKTLLANNLTLPALQQFHAQHKYIFMSHDQLKAKELGALLAKTHSGSLDDLAQQYLSSMMTLLKCVATTKNHVNTLQHIQGYLKNHISGDDKQELLFNIDQYRQGLLPLIVPITLLRHHFRHHPNDYITNTYYMQPHPGELMLLNGL
jgi:uncharacterized protein YbgA (DUF1722 family)/uncharacterized protein YbbK (DUF523 family)